MNAKWEKRRNGYFAYARHSYRNEGKTVTVNRYLGSDIKTAVVNLRLFADELHIDSSKVETLAQSLVTQGQGLRIKLDSYKYNNKDFIKRFHQTSAELSELILEADTSKKRKELQKEFIQFFNEISSFINSEK
jgi:hypothetical protein